MADEEQNEELYSLLVPLHKHRIIVPRVCVAEVVRYALSDEHSGDPAWLRGSMRWNDADIPVLSFEELAGLPSSPAGGRTRVTVFNALAGLLEPGAFGILTEGFPQLVRVNRSVMEPDARQSWPEDGPVICQLRMINEYPLIPNLEKIESMIHDHYIAATEPA